MKTRDLVLVALFAALTAIGAFIRIPVPYVPFTLQLFFSIMAGIFLGARLGMLSQVLYVGIGLLGVPVFTQGGGPGYIFQPTFGYLIGFIFSSYLVGRLVEKMETISVKNLFSAHLVGISAIYLCGLVHMYMIYNVYLGAGKSVMWVLYFGFFSCIGGDLLLSFLAALLGKKMIPTLRRLGYISR